MPTTIRVTTATLNVRRTPDATTADNIVAQLQRDQEVDLVETQTAPDWHFIRFTRAGQAIEGWVVKRLTTVITPPPPPKPPKFRITADTLNVRSQPNANDPNNIVTKLKKGDEVEALPDQPDPAFLRVRFPLNAKIVEGWVARRFVISTDAPATLAWRMGMNMREFVFYGTSAMPHTRDVLQLMQLESLKALGVKIVRIFSAHTGFTAQQTIPLLAKALDRIHGAGMKAVVCLYDSLTGKELFLEPNRQYHTEVHGHLHKRFYAEKRYRDHYLPFAQTLIGGVKDKPALLMVELGNEYAIHPQPASDADALAFIAFAKETGAAIKQIAPQVLVTTGLVNANHVAGAGKHEFYARKLYELAEIDVISIHYYQHDGERAKAPVDIAIAKALGKPWFVGEIGMERGTGDRASFYDLDIAEWRAAGAFTVMPWAFYAEPGDVGISDIYGMAPIHGDFEALKAVVTKHKI